MIPILSIIKNLDLPGVKRFVRKQKLLRNSCCTFVKLESSERMHLRNNRFVTFSLFKLMWKILKFSVSTTHYNDFVTRIQPPSIDEAHLDMVRGFYNEETSSSTPLLRASWSDVQVDQTDLLQANAKNLFRIGSIQITTPSLALVSFRYLLVLSSADLDGSGFCLSRCNKIPLKYDQIRSTT